MNPDAILEIIRFVLGAALVGANVAVWYGVWLERDSAPKEVQHRGWRILVAGLAAETAIGFVLVAIDTEIGVMQRSRIAITQERAANAEREAGRLGVDVTNLHAFVSAQEQEITSQFARFKSFAENELAKTEELIDELNRSRQDLNKARTEAQAAAKLAETELTAMQAANAPRTITPQKQPEFVARLKPFAGLKVNVFTPPSTTSDAGPLAQLLESLLTQANWKVAQAAPIAGWAKFVLACTGNHPTPNVEAAATAFVFALRANGIQAFIDPNNGPNIPLTGAGSPLPDPDMTILVGAKQ
jgi:hypothetical protein